MNQNQDDGTALTTAFKSPTEIFKVKLLTLLFECINHNSKSCNTEDLYAFARKTWDLSILLDRYTPASRREELLKWKKQLENEIAEINKTGLVAEKGKKLEAVDYRYAVEVHLHNLRILTNSPVLEVDIEGDLDIADEDIKDIVRMGIRKDDGRIEFKQ